MGMKIRTDDEVVVIAGKDKGKTGKAIRVDPKREKVYVEGLNMVKRHQRPLPGRPNMPVGVIGKGAPLNASNVALLDPNDKKPRRVRVQRSDDGRRMRVTTRSGAELD